MTIQVKLSCYRKNQPPNYADFLRQKLISKRLELKPGIHDHTKEYLERYLGFQNGALNHEEVIPPNQFYNAVLKLKGKQNLKLILKKGRFLNSRLTDYFDSPF